MYYVSGIVTDEKNAPLVGAIVDDGVKGTSTNTNGEYNLTTDKKTINFKMIGFNPQSFDLSKYQDDSSVRVNITLKTDVEGTTYKPVEIIAQRTQVTEQKKGLTKNQMKNIGLAMIGLALVLASVLVYKAVKK
jgi:hypothetical protein